MDIMELGAIGELVGGVAVIASLLFVGMQLRNGNKLAHAEAVRGYAREYNQIVLNPLVDPDTAEMVRQGMIDFRALPPREKFAVHAQWFKLMALSQVNFLSRKESLIPEAYAAQTEIADIAFLKTPGASDWWASVRLAFLDEYVAHIDRHLESDDVPMLFDVVTWLNERESTEPV